MSIFRWHSADRCKPVGLSNECLILLKEDKEKPWQTKARYFVAVNNEDGFHVNSYLVEHGESNHFKYEQVYKWGYLPMYDHFKFLDGLERSYLFGSRLKGIVSKEMKSIPKPKLYRMLERSKTKEVPNE